MIMLKTAGNDKEILNMASSVHAFDRTELDSISGEIARITQTLQTTLSLPPLIDLFYQEIAQRIGLDGMVYVNAELEFERIQGIRARNSCSYNLALSEASLGEVTFHRKKAFDQEEIARIENYLCCLLYPLRNALLYHDALAQAHKDPLTGINNRASLQENLGTEISLAQRHGSGLAIILFDIDHFKRINDSYGHQRGDCAIKSTVEAAQSCARTTDTLYRYGGEEFVLLLRNTDAKGACLLAERIRSTIEMLMIECDGQQINFTISVGVASMHADETASSLFDRADKSMYEAKAGGRNRVVCAG